MSYKDAFLEDAVRQDGRIIIENILLSSDIEKAIRENEAVLFDLIPELKNEKGFEQRSVWHCYDVWEHTIHAIINSEADVEIRLILLLHDIGKPFSFQDDANIRHFKGHAEKSAEIAETIFARLGYSPDQNKEYCFYIRNHAIAISEEMLDNTNIDRYKRLLSVQYADSSAYASAYATSMIEKLDKTREMLKKYE